MSRWVLIIICGVLVFDGYLYSREYSIREDLLAAAAGESDSSIGPSAITLDLEAPIYIYIIISKIVVGIGGRGRGGPLNPTVYNTML